MKAFKTVLGAAEYVGGLAVAAVGGTLEYVCCVIGADCPGQSFSEWEASHESIENYDLEDAVLFKAGASLMERGKKNVAEGILSDD